MTAGSGITSFESKVAAASLARPVIERQSALFDVISNSVITSSSPIASCISLPMNRKSELAE